MATAEKHAPEKTEKNAASKPEAPPQLHGADYQTAKLPGPKEAPDSKTITGEKASLANPQTDKLYPKSESGSGKAPDGSFKESEYTVKKDESIDKIARDKLGKNASGDDVNRYTQAILDENNIKEFSKIDGKKISLPGKDANGDFVYHNPDNKNEQVAVHKDWSVDAKDSSDGSGYKQQPLDKSGSYVRDYTGPNKADNVREVHDGKDDYTWTVTKNKNGSEHDVGSDGTIRDKQRDGSYTAKFGESNSKESETYDARKMQTTTKNKDGSIITTYPNSSDSRAVDPDGRVTTNKDNTQTVEKTDAAGNKTTTSKTQNNDGSYDERGTGPKPADNFHETYDPKTGQTKRVEEPGKPDEKTTTRSRDGTVKVEAKNGDSYTRYPDGSEKHADKSLDKPPYDYKNDAAMNQSRKELDQSVKSNMPEKQQADFKKDMAAFEARAQKEHLPPEEITKTYDQMSKLLSAKDTDSPKPVVPVENRALLAGQLMHQTANPSETYQGHYETCNVSTVAKETLSKHPSEMAEVATSTALKGEFKAPGGKVIKVDRDSLTPGKTEQNVRTKDGERSYATQVLNVAMVNDSLQRRDPPQTYEQHTPDRALPGDTGERRRDASGKIIEEKVKDSDGEWSDRPAAEPALTAREIAVQSKAYNGDSSHVLVANDQEGGVESYNSAKQLGQKLQQFKDQGQFPVSIGVDNNHYPFRTGDQQGSGIGGHIVNITDYDPKTENVQISDQWDSKHNGAFKLNDLYNNASGNNSSNDGGINTEWADDMIRHRDVPR